LAALKVTTIGRIGVTAEAGGIVEYELDTLQIRANYLNGFLSWFSVSCFLVFMIGHDCSRWSLMLPEDERVEVVKEGRPVERQSVLLEVLQRE